MDVDVNACVYEWVYAMHNHQVLYIVLKRLKINLSRKRMVDELLHRVHVRIYNIKMEIYRRNSNEPSHHSTVNPCFSYCLVLFLVIFFSLVFCCCDLFFKYFLVSCCFFFLFYFAWFMRFMKCSKILLRSVERLRHKRSEYQMITQIDNI